jgi:tetratricopeptide (TPR) repeat protein
MRALLLFVLIAFTGAGMAQDDKTWNKVRKGFDRGRPYGAIRTCDKMIAGKPPRPEFLVLRAEGNNRIAEFKRALKDGHAAMPQVGEELQRAAAVQLGIAYANLGKRDSARYWLERALGSADDSEALIRLGMLDRVEGSCADAIQRFGQVLDRNDKHINAMRERGACRAEMGDTTGARADLDRALELGPRDPVTFNSRGYHLYALTGRYREAIAEYDRAIKLDPNYSFAFNNRGWAFYKLGDRDRAMRNITLAGRKRRSNPYVYRNLGLIAVDDGQVDRACHNFRKALDLQFTELYGNEVRDLIRTHCGGDPAVAPKPGEPAKPQQRSNAPVRSNAP